MTRYRPTLRQCWMAILAAPVLLPGLVAPSPAAVFAPDRFVLDNGLEVVVVSDHRAPVVTHMVWYKVGATDDPSGQSGVAHFLEHLMFKGTTTLGPGEASKIIARIGGEENALTSRDYTAYYQTVTPDHLATVMAIEADRMVNLKIKSDEVDAERDVVLEERRSRTDNSDAARLAEHVNAVFFLAHPYRTPVIGWSDDIRTLTAETAEAFYRRWYAPNNAILVVAGDVTAEQVRSLATEHYGPLPRRDIATRRWVGEPPPVAARRLSMQSSQVRQPQWRRRYLAPSYVYGDRQHAYGLQVLNEILGGGTIGRLYRSLVVERKIALAAGSWYGPDGLGPSSFGFYATPADGRSVDEIEVAIDAEIQSLLETGVSTDERDGAVLRLTRAAIFARDSVTAPAWILGAALASGRTTFQVEAWPERIAAVDIADISAAAAHVLRQERSVTSVLQPEPEE